MAEVLPFPSVRRTAFLKKNGLHASGHKNPSNWIEHIADIHAQRLVRIGVDSDIAARDVSALRDGLRFFADTATASHGGGAA